jgi:hypothetical protein
MKSVKHELRLRPTIEARESTVTRLNQINNDVWWAVRVPVWTALVILFDDRPAPIP